MYKSALALTLLIASSPAVMANNFYPLSAPAPNTHHEATIGSVGLLVGTLAGGPLGALIGGSMGVMVGNHQTKTKTISTQKQTISDLEQELSQIITELDQSKITTQTAQSELKILTLSQYQLLQQHREDIIQFSNSYQYDIYFLTNSSSLTAHVKRGLVKLADLLKNNPYIHANIEAHSDWRGSNDANFLLANQRLSTVSNQLSQGGTLSNQLLTTNYGELANNHNGGSDEALFYDRRVTITLSFFE